MLEIVDLNQKLTKKEYRRQLNHLQTAVRILGYHVYRAESDAELGAQPLASVDCQGTYKDASTVPGHTYVYALASHDAAGQEHGRAFAGPVEIPLRG